MSSRINLIVPVSIVLLILALSTAAFADGSHDRTQFGHDITVGPDDQVSDVTCFGCSVRVRGRVSSDVTTFGGSIILEDKAQVTGDATAFGGNIHMDDGVKVGGDVTLFGGRLRRDPTATVGGDVTAFTGGLWMLLIFGVPLLFLGAFIALIVWLVRLVTRHSVPVAA
jgi:hypothetical protein